MFPTTRWTLVLAATSATEVSARKALSELCEMYWFPLYAYARSYGCTPHDAEDATQGFFCDFLGRQDFSKAEENKGKLRDFLRASMRNYLNKGRRKARAERRGGGAIHISIDQQSAEGRYHLEPVDALSPDVVFERHWVITLFKHVLHRLESEYAAKGKGELFLALKGSLSLDSPDRDYSKIAERFNITNGSARVTANRMKKRYREILEEEIAHTVATPVQVEEEVNHLLTLLQ